MTSVLHPTDRSPETSCVSPPGLASSTSVHLGPHRHAQPRPWQPRVLCDDPSPSKPLKLPFNLSTPVRERYSLCSPEEYTDASTQTLVPTPHTFSRPGSKGESTVLRRTSVGADHPTSRPHHRPPPAGLCAGVVPSGPSTVVGSRSVRRFHSVPSR